MSTWALVVTLAAGSSASLTDVRVGERPPVVQAAEEEFRAPLDIATGPPVPTTKMAPAFWSRGGWRNLRWGMGPGDVTERVQDFANPGWSPGPGPSGDASIGSLLASLEDPELGGPVTVELVFERAGLRSVRIERIPSQPETISEAQPTYDAVKRALRKRLGKPTCRGFVDGEACMWKTKQTRTTLRLRSTYPDLLRGTESWFGDVELEYAHPTAKDGDSHRLKSAETAHHTDPKGWSELAVNGVRLGMGVGDVVDRLSSARLSSFACRKDTDRDGTRVRCEQKESPFGEPHLREALFTPGGLLYWVRITSKPRSNAEAKQALTEFVKLAGPAVMGGRLDSSGSSFSGETLELDVYASIGYLEKFREWYFSAYLHSKGLDPAYQKKPARSPSEPPPRRGTSL